MIPTRVHGILDYVVGLGLIVFGATVYGLDTVPGAVPAILGAGNILYSLVTAYELGVVKVLPMKGHLAIDVIAGLVLAVSPWLFGFSDRTWAPHLCLGLFELLVVAMSARTSPVEQRRPATAH